MMEAITQPALQELMKAQVIRGASVVGRPEGWSIFVQYGSVERILSGIKSHQPRIFKDLNTVVAYLKAIGIAHFKVDTAAFDKDKVIRHKRPDRTEELQRMRKAAKYDQWFRAEVEQAIIEADNPNTVWVPHEQVMADMDQRIMSLDAKIKSQKHKS